MIRTNWQQQQQRKLLAGTRSVTHQIGRASSTLSQAKGLDTGLLVGNTRTKQSHQLSYCCYDSDSDDDDDCCGNESDACFDDYDYAPTPRIRPYLCRQQLAMTAMENRKDTKYEPKLMPTTVTSLSSSVNSASLPLWERPPLPLPLPP